MKTGDARTIFGAIEKHWLEAARTPRTNRHFCAFLIEPSSSASPHGIWIAIRSSATRVADRHLHEAHRSDASAHPITLHIPPMGCTSTSAGLVDYRSKRALTELVGGSGSAARDGSWLIALARRRLSRNLVRFISVPQAVVRRNLRHRGDLIQHHPPRSAGLVVHYR